MAHSHPGAQTMPRSPRCSSYFTEDASPRQPSNPSAGVPLFGTTGLAVDVGAWLAALSTALEVLKEKLPYNWAG